MEPYKQSNLGNKCTYRFSNISYAFVATYTTHRIANIADASSSNDAPDFGTNSWSYGRLIHVESHR